MISLTFQNISQFHTQVKIWKVFVKSFSQYLLVGNPIHLQKSDAILIFLVSNYRLVQGINQCLMSFCDFKKAQRNEAVCSTERVQSVSWINREESSLGLICRSSKSVYICRIWILEYLFYHLPLTVKYLPQALLRYNWHITWCKL